MWRQAQRLWYWSDELAPRWHWEIDVGPEDKANEKNDEEEKSTKQQDIPVLPPISRVSTSSSKGDDRIEVAEARR